MGIIALLHSWREQYAQWSATGYLNCHLARRLGHPKGRTYDWYLHGNDGLPHVATWLALIWAEDPGKLIAYTTVKFNGRDVVVGASFEYGDLISEHVPPIRIIITEVPPKLPVFTSDWRRDPAIFTDPQTFANLAAQC